MYDRLGSGSAESDVLSFVLERAGVSPPVETPSWSLQERVRVLDYVPKNKPFLIALDAVPSDAFSLLSAHAGMLETARRLLVGIAPCHDPRYPLGTIGGCYGCKTDVIEDFGQVYSSCTTSLGFVEGIVSSLANWKLYALAIRHYGWTDEFLTGSPDVLYAHPLRPLEQVPAGAVLHTAYCTAHILAWHVAVQKAFGDLAGVAYRISVCRDRAQVSITELMAIRTTATADGQALIDAVVGWLNTLLMETTT